MTVEEVYTNAFSASKVAWIETGTSPYLHDTDADYIRTSTDFANEGDWTFPNSAGSGTINSVKLRFEADVTQEGCASVAVYVWNGSSWVYAKDLHPTTSYTWLELDVSSILNTWTKINDVEVYLEYGRVLSGIC